MGALQLSVLDLPCAQFSHLFSLIQVISAQEEFEVLTIDCSGSHGCVLLTGTSHYHQFLKAL
jgi:hypothetical protein